MQRVYGQNRDQTSGIESIKHKLIGGRSKWTVTEQKIDSTNQNGKYIYICTMHFEKKHGQKTEDLVNREWLGILENLSKLGSSGNFQTYPWVVIDVYITH